MPYCLRRNNKKNQNCYITLIYPNFPHIRATCHLCLFLKEGLTNSCWEPVSGLLKFKPHPAWDLFTQDTRFLAFELQTLSPPWTNVSSSLVPQRHSSDETEQHPQSGSLTFSMTNLISYHVSNENREHCWSIFSAVGKRELIMNFWTTCELSWSGSAEKQLVSSSWIYSIHMVMTAFAWLESEA